MVVVQGPLCHCCGDSGARTTVTAMVMMVVVQGTLCHCCGDDGGARPRVSDVVLKGPISKSLLW